MFSQGVFDARRHFRIDLAVDKVVAFELAQLLREHFFRRPGEEFLQFIEAPDLPFEVKQNRGLPLSTDNASRECDRTVDGIHLKGLS